MKEMKNKTFVIAILVLVAVFGLVFFLVGKRGGGAAPAERDISAALSQPFDAQATIKMKDLTLLADVNRTAPGRLTVAIREPKSLSGMSFAYDGSDVIVSYKGLSVKLNEHSRLVSSLVSMIVNSIDKAASPSGVNVAVDGDALTVSGESDSGKFVLRLDKENGSIASVSVPEMDFECRFDDFLFQK